MTRLSYSEVMAALGDNVTRQISPQDLRDAFESLAKPPTQQDSFSIYAYNQHIAVAHNTAFWIPVNYDAGVLTGYDPNPDISKVLSSDPLGMATFPTDDPEPYGNHVGGNYLKNIPQGSIWGMHLHIGWELGTWTLGDPVQIANAYPLPNYVYPDNYLEDTAAGIWGAPQYAYTGGLNIGWSGGAQQMDSDAFVVPFYESNLFEGPWHAASPYVFQTSGETQYMNNYQFDFWRVH